MHTNTYAHSLTSKSNLSSTYWFVSELWDETHINTKRNVETCTDSNPDLGLKLGGLACLSVLKAFPLQSDFHLMKRLFLFCFVFLLALTYTCSKKNANIRHEGSIINCMKLNLS